MSPLYTVVTSSPLICLLDPQVGRVFLLEVSCCQCALRSGSNNLWVTCFGLFCLNTISAFTRKVRSLDWPCILLSRQPSVLPQECSVATFFFHNFRRVYSFVIHGVSGVQILLQNWLGWVLNTLPLEYVLFAVISKEGVVVLLSWTYPSCANYNGS